MGVCLLIFEHVSVLVSNIMNKSFQKLHKIEKKQESIQTVLHTDATIL